MVVGLLILLSLIRVLSVRLLVLLIRLSVRLLVLLIRLSVGLLVLLIRLSVGLLRILTEGLIFSGERIVNIVAEVRVVFRC